jgi:predicted nuclease of predicted toxin-antitoxin system
LKILLDECVDARLARETARHEVRTVQEMGWAGEKDGSLLALASGTFDAFVTTDRNLEFQQNLAKHDVAVLVLRAKTNRLADLRCLVPNLLAALPTAPAGRAMHADL